MEIEGEAGLSQEVQVIGVAEGSIEEAEVLIGEAEGPIVEEEALEGMTVEGNHQTAVGLKQQTGDLLAGDPFSDTRKLIN